MTDSVVHCPECGAKMHRMGKAWSGRKRVQRYRCPKCGRTYAPVDRTINEQINEKTNEKISEQGGPNATDSGT